MKSNNNNNNKTSSRWELWTRFLFNVKNSILGSSESREDYNILISYMKWKCKRENGDEQNRGKHIDPLLGVHQRHDRLEPGEGIWPGVAEGRGTMLGQVLLSQETEQAEDPGIFDRLSEYPDVGWALHIIMAVDQDRIPLHQPLKIHTVGQW